MRKDFRQSLSDAATAAEVVEIVEREVVNA
jgi:hypothetical protein